MENRIKFLRILFPVMICFAPFIWVVWSVFVEGKAPATLVNPNPLMNLIIFAIIVASLLLTYHFYKEDEGTVKEKS